MEGKSMTNNTDPALGAIAEFIRMREAADAALVAYQDAIEGGDFRAAEERFGEANTAAFFARDAAFKTRPTTLDGAVALLRLVAATISELGHDPDHQPAIAGAIVAAADAIFGARS
jgi:hypothetical protein